jgi:hypothetical protein
VTRANAHQVRSHNPRLVDFVLEQKFTVEVAGPFESRSNGLLVETALISALKPDFNVVQGQARFRFRPLGVPINFARRLSMPALQRNEFLSLQGDAPMPVLFVTVGDRDFGDGRAGYNLAMPPTDDQILERVREWWQLSRLVPDWVDNFENSPGLLIGINGRPGAQIVIASLRINRKAWGDAKRCPENKSKIRVPTLQTPMLDAFNLRGRRVDRNAGLAFEGIPAGFFIVLRRSGRLSGGRRPRK